MNYRSIISFCILALIFSPNAKACFYDTPSLADAEKSFRFIKSDIKKSMSKNVLASLELELDYLEALYKVEKHYFIETDLFECTKEVQSRVFKISSSVENLRTFSSSRWKKLSELNDFGIRGANPNNIKLLISEKLREFEDEISSLDSFISFTSSGIDDSQRASLKDKVSQMSSDKEKLKTLRKSLGISK